MAYGICAGAGFATVENLMYVLRSSLGTAFVRAFLSVPLHCTTGAIIGMGLAAQRYFGPAIKPFWSIMIVPWILHGSYDSVLMLGESDGNPVLGIISFATALAIYIAGLIYARFHYIEIDAALPKPRHTIHELLATSNVILFCLYS